MAVEYTLPKLPFGFQDLEPIMSAEVLHLHYEKHHAGYVKNVNDALLQYEQTDDLSRKIQLTKLITFHGGGHINHTLFWENLIPPAGAVPLSSGPLFEAINITFGSVARCQELVTAASMGVQGSGWGWLGLSRDTHQLCVETTQNHDLLITKGCIPLLCIDVWEHAYYLQHKNMRANFLSSIWKIMNWNVVEQRFMAALS